MASRRRPPGSYPAPDEALRIFRRFSRGAAGTLWDPATYYETSNALATANEAFWNAILAAPQPEAGRPAQFYPGLRLQAELWQHPVGQGLFHSGMIQIGTGTPFRYVYDCGRKPDGDWPRLLRPMAAEYGRRPLDAVFISHFDSDHINGLTELLGIYRGAKRAFLPYLSPIRRLLIAARDVERGALPDDEHLTMLDDPARWLFDRGVDEVIFTGNPPGGPGSPLPPNPDQGPNDEGPIVELLKEPLKGMGLTEQEDSYLAFNRGAGAPSLKFMNHVSPILLVDRSARGVGWVFQTYVDPDPEMDRSIRAEVSRELGPSAVTALAQGNLECSTILWNSRLRSKLAAAYRKGSRLAKVSWPDVWMPLRRGEAADRSHMNRTTMSLYSGPVVWGNRGAPIFHRLHGDASDEMEGTLGPIADLAGRDGWLLLGDATLADRDVLDRLTTFFGAPQVDYLSKTRAFTVPHHGSSNNLIEESMDRLGPMPIAVIPAGNKTYWDHPNDDVIELLAERCMQTAHVHAGFGDGLRHRIEVP